MSTPLSGVIADFSLPYTVTRTLASSLSNGKAVAGVSTTFTIQAASWPAGGEEILRLEEGERTKEARVFVTEGSLRTQGNGFEADIITVGSDTYQVSAVEDWTQFGFVKATATKRGRV